MKNNSSRIISTHREYRIYKGIKSSVEERFKVREMWYYHVSK
jgi:hypothetical protein